MSIPVGDDSDWADLASELGLETKPAPQIHRAAEPAAFETQHTLGEPPAFPETPWPREPETEPARDTGETGFAAFSDLPDAVESNDDADTLLDATLANEEFAPEDGDGDAGEAAEGEADGPPGTGRKRRRRRRRRKGGASGEASEGAPEGADVDAEGELEPVVPAEPRTTADAIRELVKNWTVPSWNEVVGGLYRPGGQDR